MPNDPNLAGATAPAMPAAPADTVVDIPEALDQPITTRQASALDRLRQTGPDDDDDLSARVQRRIGKEVAKRRDLERENMLLRGELQKSNSALHAANTVADNSEAERAKAELERAEADWEAAYEAGDKEKIKDAQRRQAIWAPRAAAFDEAKARNGDRRPPPNGDANARTDATRTDPAPAQISERAQQWIDDHPWFDRNHADFDEVKAAAAIAIHNRIVRSGVQGDTDRYYEELDRQLADAGIHGEEDGGSDPNKGKDPADEPPPRRQAAVAAPGRGGDSRPADASRSLRSIRLTADQRDHAKAQGISEPMYALGVLREQGKISQEEYTARRREIVKAEGGRR